MSFGFTTFELFVHFCGYIKNSVFSVFSVAKLERAGMKSRSIVAAIILMVVIGGGCMGPAPQKEIATTTEDIRLNSLGYLPAAQKKATIISACSRFSIKDASTGKTAYSAKAKGPFSQQDVNQTVWIADFSKVSKPGRYYIDVPGVGRSYEFEIGDKVYNNAFKTSMRAFYLWRCGTAVEGDYNGNHYYHAACHTDDALLDYLGEPNVTRDGTGGWHDAGDFNKYVVNAGVTVGVMLWAWEHYQDKIKDVSLGIPETAPGWPDFLKEIKWEYDWLFKMQFPDGSGRVSHKVSALGFCDFVMPEDEPNKRYFTDWSSPATGQFVAMMAMGARVFKPYDQAYAQKCLDAAKVSYEFLKKNPQQKMIERGDFRTGFYPKLDYDDRIWAAAEMWETTGDPNCLMDCERRIGSEDDKINLCWDWNHVKNLGMFTYLMSKRQGRRDALVADVRNDLIETANMLVARAKHDVYGRCLGGEYRWGCNGELARTAITLMMANKVSPNPDYVNTVQEIIDHIFGRNYYGRSYVTCLGHLPPMFPHDRRSGADNIIDPWPGYIVGGGHTATGWQDIQKDATTNEVCINWQGALVYALAGFVN
jgi:endoglucanase